MANTIDCAIKCMDNLIKIKGILSEVDFYNSMIFLILWYITYLIQIKKRMKRNTIVLCLTLIAAVGITSCNKLNPNAPKACFSVPAEMEAGVTIAFNSSCSENAVTFLWSFGDGETSAEANPEHTYAEEGIYTVYLMVGNNLGASNEASQSITVSAPPYIEHSGTIESDETWIGDVHLISSNLYVDGAILTIEPGAVVMFAAGAGIYLGYHSGFSGATLLANGTVDKPITFTSAGTTKSAGDWDYFGFYDGASTVSSMQHCLVEYGGGYSENYGMIHITGSSVSIENSIFRYSESFGFSLGDDGFFQSFTMNTLNDNGSHPISIYANHAHTIGTGNTITTDKGILVKNDDIEQENAIWLKQTCPYILSGNIYVESTTAAKLTIMPGVEVQMGNGAAIYMGYHSGTFGTLIADGTADERILFTSSAPAMSKSPGDWDMLAFYGGAGTSSSMAYCDIEYGGGYSEHYGMIFVEESGVSISNSTIKNSLHKGITLRDDGSFTAFTDNTLESNAKYPIEIYSNWVHTIGTGNTFSTGPGIFVKGDDMEQSDVTWLKHNVPYILDGNHYIESSAGANLTIESGTTVKFTESAAMYVGYHTGTFGNLIAIGEAGNEILFTSGAASGFEAPGDWDGLWFYDGTGSGTKLDRCIISYGGGYSANSGNLNIRNETAGIPVISNCQIKYSSAWGIYLGNNANPQLTDNTFTGNATGASNQ